MLVGGFARNSRCDAFLVLLFGYKLLLLTSAYVFVVQYPSRILPNKLVFLDWFCCGVHRSSSRCLYEIGWVSFVIPWWLLAICYCIISQSFLLLCLGDGWMDGCRRKRRSYSTLVESSKILAIKGRTLDFGVLFLGSQTLSTPSNDDKNLTTLDTSPTTLPCMRCLFVSFSSFYTFRGLYCT